MDEIEEIRTRFPLTREAIFFHSYHLYDSRRLRRLPDMTLVYAEEYEQRLSVKLFLESEVSSDDR